MAHGALRRSKVVALDVGDYASGFGLTRVKGTGGDETGVALPRVAQDVPADYIEHERPDARERDPLKNHRRN
jgi:hypothetical protein